MTDQSQRFVSAEHKVSLGLRLFSALLMLVLFAGLVWVLLSLPEQTTGLRGEVAAQLSHSGVSYPVTAVLINFRGYDTLLEMSVLLLSLVAVWSLEADPHLDDTSPGPVLDRFAQLYAPMMILVAGYLLWNGGHAAGGAFQGGAVLAAAAVLLLLAGRRLGAPLTMWPLRLVIVLGLLVFLSLALAMLWHRGVLLQYPPSYAGLIIVLIESAATLSIGVTMAALFIGGRPEDAP